MKKCLFAILTTLTLTGVAHSQVVFSDFTTPYTQDFDSFEGDLASIPSGFFWEEAGGTDTFRGVFIQPFDAASTFTGVMAATVDGSNYSFVWRESTGGASLDDGRLFLQVFNGTGAPITGFQISYDVEAWVNGRRDNRVRLKYDTLLDSPDRATFETDIFSTINPNHTPIAANGDQFTLNGNLAANRTEVSGFVDLTTLLINEEDPSAGFFGALGAGETAYFRWQISNADLTEGNRSALGINNLSITAVPEPASGSLLAGALGLAWLLRRRIQK